MQDIQPQKTIRVAAYARCSLVLRGDPDLQIANIKEYASRNQLTVVKTYTDRVSGTKAKRPGLDELLRDCKAKKFDAVVVVALDRLGRNTRNMLELADFFRENNIGLISLRESISLDTPSGRAFFAICSVLSALDRDQISERIKEALAAKKLIAASTGNGWRAGRPSQLTSALESEIRALRTQGHSIRQIQRLIEGKVSRGTIQRITQAMSSGDQNGSSDGASKPAKSQGRQVAESPRAELANGRPSTVDSGRQGDSNGEE